MYLKALRLVGFKSFAEKAELSLSRGVTAIVGPNGSGKSNLLDAIRWALGEQSPRVLRAVQMQDVLFGGSEAHAPLGLAEVSLLFADCDRLLSLPSSELTVTRRLYRDGKSEYEINGTPARLRDLHDLFRNTGGACSAYSFFEQGRIDQVLSAHPEDRRELFEEAAGIAKFQADRREVGRRLEAAQDNLARLDDILRELERQLGTLRKQAARVQRHRTITERLREVHQRLYARRFRQLRLQCDGFEAERAHLQREREDGAGRLSVHETQ
ncbi:MAG: AAA family ATPase, partial [Methylacidiphilaceae bacterium]|nr:AAA family ATPase [Candidatus Methylacidiphilaceae bacterium]